ncbi:MAG: TolC family protein [Betaproteobacteria bacterium]|nr:TolC family protein [Betaproteobacteria bacterium]
MKRVAVTALAVTLMLAGCARESYRPKPPDPDGSAAALAVRSLASGELRRYLDAQGRSQQSWPRQSWDLSSLTLAAVFHHPEIEVARARARLAAAEKDTSKTRLPYTLTARPEFNDKESGGDTPWGMGVLVGLPLDTGGKRQARTEQLERIEEAAKLEVAVATWRVRSRLRRHFVDLYVADRTRKALDAEHSERGRLLALMEKRLSAGMVSAADVSALRIRQAESGLALQRAAVRQDQALAGVAEAVGVPLAELERVEFDFAAVSQPAPRSGGRGAPANRAYPPDRSAAQACGLRGRRGGGETGGGPAVSRHHTRPRLFLGRGREHLVRGRPERGAADCKNARADPRGGIAA